MHRPLLLVTGVFVLLIGLVLLIDPDSYLRLYVVQYDPEMDFAARRFSPAVLGLGVLLILARSLPACGFLIQLCAITALVFWGVAATGLGAWFTGQAQAAILGAAALEAVIGLLFALCARHLARQARIDLPK